MFPSSLSRIAHINVILPLYVRRRQLARLSPTMVASELIRKGTICVEGNIGCGKTTLLEFFKDQMPASKDSVVAEPVELWRNVEGENLFHYLYKDPARYSLAFQTYVQLTMIKLHSKNPRLMERSIYSARYCFVENLFKLNYLSRLEYVILDKWFKHLVLGSDESICDKDSNKELEYELLSRPREAKIDLIVYLRCSPQKVMDRIRVRSRTEEREISFDYINSLHTLHEDWLIRGKYPVPAPVLVLDTDCRQSSLVDLYEIASPYLTGQKRVDRSLMTLSLNGDNETVN